MRIERARRGGPRLGTHAPPPLAADVRQAVHALREAIRARQEAERHLETMRELGAPTRIVDAEAKLATSTRAQHDAEGWLRDLLGEEDE